MPLMSIFDIAGSGMSAQSVRLNTTASNLANADTVSSTEGAIYRSRQPVFAAVMDDVQQEMALGSVQVKGIVESSAVGRAEHDPDHPMANEQGYIFHSNVDSMSEMANMISATRSYENNVEVANTSKQLLLETLRLGQ